MTVTHRLGGDTIRDDGCVSRHLEEIRKYFFWAGYYYYFQLGVRPAGTGARAHHIRCSAPQQYTQPAITNGNSATFAGGIDVVVGVSCNVFVCPIQAAIGALLNIHRQPQSNSCAPDYGV